MLLISSILLYSPVKPARFLSYHITQLNDFVNKQARMQSEFYYIWRYTLTEIYSNKKTPLNIDDHYDNYQVA